jgi:hypothetical protein
MKGIIFLLSLAGFSILLSQEMYAQTLVNKGQITVKAGETLTIKGGYTAEAGATLENNGNIELTGDWINNSGNNGFTNVNAGKVIFNGNVQNIAGTSPTIFNDIEVNGASNKVVLQNTPQEINGITTFNQGKIDLNGNIYLIKNSSTNAINIATANGGFLNNTTNFDGKVQWNIAGNTGNYQIPFADNAGTRIPFAFNIGTAGSGATGNLLVSTYGVGSDNTPFPTGITDAPESNPLNTLDRYWLINPTNFTTNPTASFSLGYLDSEWGAPNSITESQMKIRNYASGAWGVDMPTTVNIATNTATLGTNISNFGTGIFTLYQQTIPLPIKLLNINAQAQNEDILLTWKTAQEINNKGYEIQRSENARNFEVIGFVDAKGGGNTTQERNYAFLDKNVKANQDYYYRFKQIDYNGNFEYSPIVRAKVIDENVRVVMLYPNPATDHIFLNFQAKQQDTASYFISDVKGNILQRGTMNISQGETNYKIDLQKYISSGTYLIKCVFEGKSFVEKIVIQK